MSDLWADFQRLDRTYVEGSVLTASDIDAIEWAVAEIERLRAELDEARAIATSFAETYSAKPWEDLPWLEKKTPPVDHSSTEA